MSSIVGHSSQTLLLLFAWMFTDSSSLIFTQNHHTEAWTKFWNRLQTTSASNHPNLLSSCPWDYVRKADNRVVVQLFPFATHCIDLYKSGPGGPFFVNGGRCRPISFPVPGCGGPDQTKVVAFTCVHSAEILANKRGSNLNNTWWRFTMSKHATPSTTPAGYVTDKIRTPVLPFYNKPDGDHSSSLTAGVSLHQEHQDSHGGHLSGASLQQYHQQNVRPSYLNSVSAQLNRTLLLSQNVPLRLSPPPIIFGHHNPQLGGQPFQRPLSLMDVVKGNVRSDNTVSP